MHKIYQPKLLVAGLMACLSVAWLPTASAADETFQIMIFEGPASIPADAIVTVKARDGTSKTCHTIAGKCAFRLPGSGTYTFSAVPRLEKIFHSPSKSVEVKESGPGTRRVVLHLVRKK